MALTPGPAKPVWWVIDERDLMAMLERVAAGEDPAIVYAEEYANCSHEHLEGDT